jgi:cytochrome c554/c'-like protein
MRVALIVLVLLAVAAVATRVIAGRHHAEPVRPASAAGDAVCLSCHQQQAAFEQTAHRLTSRLPTRANLMGSFHPGANVLRTANPQLHFRMDSTADGYYQTAVMGRGRDTTTRSERIAYVTGSRKGQSFLYWHDDRLYQLPVSYWAALGWANSPAYPDGRANFDRQIPPRCLECHATWFESVPDSSVVNRYRASTALLGLSCETCHAAGRTHVSRARSVLRAVLPPAIVNPARLSRQRQLDACALCHGGTEPLRSAPFAYVPGQPLEKKFVLGTAPDTDRVDVHGNQVALLERSQCFRRSQMTCATCHDVHREQRDVAAFSQRCLSCHTVQSCGLYPQQGDALRGRCVDCHMPALPSSGIVANRVGGAFHVNVRTHWIKVYPPPAGDSLQSARQSRR